MDYLRVSFVSRWSDGDASRLFAGLAGRDLMDLTSAAKSKIPARQITDSWASNALAVGSCSSRRAGTEAGICSDEENGVDLGSPADCRYRCEFLKRNSQGRGR